MEHPGLKCPNCGRISIDLGGGRACYKHDERGTPTERCGTMQPITLVISVKEE